MLFRSIEEGLKKFPSDALLLFQTNFVDGINAFRKNDFNTAIKFLTKALQHKDDKIAIQNIALAYYNLNSFSEAIPYFSDIIARKLFLNGKSEFLRGMCFLKLGQKDKAFDDFIAAKNLGFNVAPTLIESTK